MNVVKTGDGRFIELQGTAEGQPFDRRALDALLALADDGHHGADREAARHRRRLRSCRGASKTVRMTLLVATTNPGKLREIRGILRDAPDRARLARSISGIASPRRRAPRSPRTRGSKRSTTRRRRGLPAVADDSGLEIDALGSEPGVHSARWHGDRLSDQVRGDLRAAAARGLETSPARFVAHIAVARRREASFSSRPASSRGRSRRNRAATHGFGYDPIFFYPAYGCTLAEVDGAKKAAVSHRGQAFRQLDGLESVPTLTDPDGSI